MAQGYREGFNILDSNEFNALPLSSLKNSYSFTMQHNIETGVQYYAAARLGPDRWRD